MIFVLRQKIMAKYNKFKNKIILMDLNVRQCILVKLFPLLIGTVLSIVFIHLFKSKL